MTLLRRRRRKRVADRNPIAVALVGLLLMGFIGGLAYSAEDLPVVGGGTTYSADFTEAAGLRSGSEVRIAGMKVGKVTRVALDGAKVRVDFRVKDVWIGDASTVAIAIKTVLGDKYLAVDPLGAGDQKPEERIPASRTTSPYDVVTAFQDLSGTIDQIDTEKLAQSLDTMAETFSGTAPGVRKTLSGMSALSKTIASRDDELAKLFQGTKKATGQLAARTSDFETLLRDGNLLLGELQRRRQAIHSLLVGTRTMSEQLTGLVEDNQKQLKPTLQALGEVADVLQRNQDNLDRALKLTAPYTRLLGNALGNGRWMDGYLCGLVPDSYQADPPAAGCLPPKQEGQ